MSKNKLLFQTLTSNGWRSTVERSTGSSADDLVYRVTTKNTLVLTEVGKVEQHTGVTCLERRATGDKAYCVDGVPMLVPEFQGNVTALREIDRPAGRLGSFFVPARIKAYTAVDAQAYESIGEDFWLGLKNCVLKKDTSSRIQRLGAQYCRWYIQQWNAINHGLFATNESTCAELQAILMMTGEMSRVRRTAIYEVIPFSNDSWRPDTSSAIPSAMIDLLYDPNGIYIHTVRREVYSGLMFVL